MSTGAPIVSNPADKSDLGNGFPDSSIAYVLGGAFSTPELMSFDSKALFSSKGELVNAQSNLGLSFSFGDNWLASATTRYDRLSDHQITSELNISEFNPEFSYSSKASFAIESAYKSSISSDDTAINGFFSATAKPFM